MSRASLSHSSRRSSSSRSSEKAPRGKLKARVVHVKERVRERMQNRQPLSGRWTKHIPNLMTTVRLILIIPFVILLAKGHNSAAAIVYIIALFTDLDGTVARKLKATSKFGAFYDPTVDAIFMVTAFVLLFGLGRVSLVPLAIYWASALVRLVFTLLNYRAQRELATTYVSKTIAFTGYISVLLATLLAPPIVTSTILIAGAIANITLTLYWLGAERLHVRKH